jgi:hypothetical protein
VPIIDIHPYDLLGLLNARPDSDVFILKNSGRINEPATDLIRIDGQLYRQTIHAPITTEHGKRIQEGLA